MKNKFVLTAFFLSFIIHHSAFVVSAATTVGAANHYAYAANLGWVDWRGDIANGAIIGDYVCSGSIYSANVGWINLGSGSPTNQIRYQNLAANDFGVNHDGAGNLRGYAYGANIGWVNFENTGAPKVDLLTGKLSGSIYSANCGWISLSNSFAFVQTDSFDPGSLAANGLPIPWLMENFGTTAVNTNRDADGDGLNVTQEYLAGTDPNGANRSLRITSQFFVNAGTGVTLQWTSVSNRVYHIEKTVSLSAPVWNESPFGAIAPDAGAFTVRGYFDTNSPIRFFRIRAARPLLP